MEAIVAGAKMFRLLDAERRIGGQTSGLRIEPELRNKIGTRAILRGLQDIIDEAGDVRDKGKLVGGVGLDRVGAVGRVLPIKGWCAYRAIISNRMDRRIPALIVGGQQVSAGAVGCKKRRRISR
jgi:hypothetical protein